MKKKIDSKKLKEKRERNIIRDKKKLIKRQNKELNKFYKKNLRKIIKGYTKGYGDMFIDLSEHIKMYLMKH